MGLSAPMGIQGQKMNERIQKLAQEAGMYVDLNGKPWPKSMSAEECEAAYKKFAELIVAECAMFVVVELEGQVGSLIADRTANRLEEHFGVESQARVDQEAAAFIAAEDKKVASRYGYFPKLHPSEWKDK